MTKSKFTYFGQAGLTIVLAVWTVILALSFIIGFQAMENKDKLFLLFGGPFLILAIVVFWRMLLNELREIKIDNAIITLTSVLTKKEKKIEIDKLKGFKNNIWSNHILLIDKNEKIVTRIYEPFYKDFKNLLGTMELEYLGRTSTWFSRLTKK